jgi:hypothetical protein
VIAPTDNVSTVAVEMDHEARRVVISTEKPAL